MIGGSVQADLITNGSLEAGLSGFHNYNISSELGTHKYGPPTFGATMPTGWTRTGSRNWMGTDNGATTAFPEANGDYVMRLDANGAGGVDKFLRANISLEAGTTYDFQIDIWSELAGGGALLNADLTGPATVNILSGFADPASVGVHTIMESFVAPVTGTYTLELYNPQSPSSNNHTWIDNVSLVAAVPEPHTLTLLSLGALALGLRRSRR